MGFLTDRAFITGLTNSNLFHIVDVNDISQGNPDGSSYKASIGQFLSFFDNQFVNITGDTMSGPLLLPNLTANTSTIGELNVTGITNTDTLIANTSTIGELDVTGSANTYTLIAKTAHTGTLIIVNGPTEVYTNEVLVRNSLTGEVEKKDLTHYNFGFYVQTGNTRVSNTIVESTILSSGIGTLSVQPNSFSIGDSFHVKVGGGLDALNTSTLTIKVKLGSAILGTNIITFPNGVTSKPWEFTCDFTILALGVAGVGNLHSNGFFRFNVSSDILGGGFSTSNSATFDTTILNTLDITVEWDSASASNSIYSLICTLNKIY